MIRSLLPQLFNSSEGPYRYHGNTPLYTCMIRSLLPQLFNSSEGPHGCSQGRQKVQSHCGRLKTQTGRYYSFHKLVHVCVSPELLCVSVLVGLCCAGRHCLRQLVQSGIKCSYIFINAVSYIMKEVHTHTHTHTHTYTYTHTHTHTHSFLCHFSNGKESPKVTLYIPTHPRRYPR